MNKTFDWTEEACAQLTKLWNEDGLSTREIGIAMGITKNMVIGKARRLRLAARRNPILPKSLPAVFGRAPRDKIKTYAKIPIPASLPSSNIKVGKKIMETAPQDCSSLDVSILDMHEGMCKWVTHTSTADRLALYCGDKIKPGGGAYCPHHHKLSYVTLEQARSHRKADLEKASAKFNGQKPKSQIAFGARSSG